ncbi:MAG: hypothetical protein LCH95_07180 [Proteobacteria bacterium]|nr:hypothetical protein [Pseudomonadota bacterium]
MTKFTHFVSYNMGGDRTITVDTIAKGDEVMDMDDVAQDGPGPKRFFIAETPVPVMHGGDQAHGDNGPFWEEPYLFALDVVTTDGEELRIHASDRIKVRKPIG